MKRLAEKQELERKQLELEKRLLALEKQHSQERYDLEVSLVEEEGRSLTSRLSEIESRKREKQISSWIEDQTATVVTSQGRDDAFAQKVSENSINTVLPQVPMNQTHQPESPLSFPAMRSLQQQQQPSVEQLQVLEAEIRSYRLQLQQRSSVLCQQQHASKGAIPKTVPTVGREAGAQQLRQKDHTNETRLADIITSSQEPRSSTEPAARSSRVRIANNEIQTHSVPPLGGDLNYDYLQGSQAPVPLLQMNSFEKPRTLYANSKSAEQESYIPNGSFPGGTQLNEMTRRPTQEQLAARQVMPRDLPDFSGEPEEWPMFFNSYMNTTAACGYNNLENLARLQRCLKGKALKSVRYYLLEPNSVPEVMKTLQTLFGRPEVIINRLISNVRQTPAPKMERLDTLIDFGVSVRNLTQHLIAAGQQAHLSNPILLQELVEKLPANIKLQWAQHVTYSSTTTLQMFSDFMTSLIESVSKIIVYTSESGNTLDKPKGKGFIHAHVETQGQTSSTKTEGTYDKPCLYCGKVGHRLKACTKFQQLTVDDRWKSIYTLKVCRICLNPHGRRMCRLSIRCGIDGCQFRHHPLLHGKAEAPTKNLESVTFTENHVHHHCGQSVLFRVIPVTVHGAVRSINVFAFLDEGSSATLVERDLIEELGITGPTEPLCLRWTSNMTRTEEESQIVTIDVSQIGRKNRYQLKGVRTVEHLNLPPQTLRFEELQYSYPELKGLPIRSYESATPKLLIGLRDLQLAVPQKIREGRGDLVATKTRLGWCVYGSFNENREGAQLNYHICDCKTEDKLDRMVKEYFNSEDYGVSHEIKLESEEEKRALCILENKTVQVGDRFKTGLLWRSDHIELPDSYPMALRRLECLERRMMRDPFLRENLHQQVIEYEAQGYAYRATDDELAGVDLRRVWYVPLGVVVNPKKPGKVRLVCDFAASVNGMSLNSFLLSGPDLLTALPSVLFRFRQFPVAVAGDIKQMFHQILIDETDRHAQRFLWRETPEKTPEIYIMDVMTFGARCSPTAAGYVMKFNASKFAAIHPRAVEGIMKGHYVDDYLDSFESVTEAQSIVNEVRLIHSKGGFEMRNWTSNCQAVLENLGEFPEQTSTNLSLPSGSNSERVLGMLWRPEEDVLSFENVFSKEITVLIEAGDRPTKRQMLKCVMSLFDPLGLLASFLVHGKILMQDVWRSGIGWDERVNDSIYGKWKRWIALFDRVNEIRIPRCYFAEASSQLYESLEAHVFVDASEAAYSAVIYFRVENRDKSIQCSLIAAKTKVAPLKYVSIPRLELMAAVLGVRLFTFVRENHTIPIGRCIFWSDSVTTLAWIKSEHRKYRPFVACRVGEILTSSNDNDWRWVPTKINIADEATKWGKGPCSGSESRWFSGPEYLYLPETQWPRPKNLVFATEEELRPCHLHQIVPALSTPIRFDRFSKWNRLLRATAYVLRFVNLSMKRETIPHTSREHLTHEELRAAEIMIFRLVQSECFTQELAILTSNKSLPLDKRRNLDKSSPLYTLTPMLDDYKVMRMDGRINAARTVSVDVKFPVILPRNHWVTYLIVDHYHREFLHGNSETVVNELRQKFYLSKLRVLVRKIANQCQHCKVYKAKINVPRMGELPAARLSPYFRPFSYVGIDYFGPIMVKVGRSAAKRWICLITCLTIRAVHVEVAYDLTTKSCVSCIRRFVCRRGAPLEIYSDNGRNFSGADRLLKEQIGQIEKDAATTFTNTRTKWVFIPPSAPHMGGSWERLVRSIKTAMTSLPHNQKLDDEGLQTLVVEAEAIVNSRPLTYLPLDSAEQEALTPNHFILGSSSGIKQPMVKVNEPADVARTSRDFMQLCTDHFWRRWIREYLPTITKRTKWFEESKAVEPGSLVVVIDESRKNGWIRGRVLEVIAGNDGRVRQAMVQTSGGLFRRPVSKLAVLDVAEPGKSDDPVRPYGEGDVATGAPLSTT